jgi:NADPH-dependent ferric siderophore reductase
MPTLFAGLHIKLFFKKGDQESLTLPTRVNGRIKWPESHLKPTARTYSIYHFDHDKNELTVDFVIHEAAGPACDFARSAQPGDKIGFAGPGPVSLINRECSHFIFACDLSSIPAVSSVINSMNTHSSIAVFFEAEQPETSEEIINEYLPDYAKFVTVLPQIFDPKNTLVEPVLKALHAKDTSSTSFAIAGEHESVVALRDVCREHGIPKENLYAVPYWRHNQNEETYHQTRHDVMDS